MMTPKEKATELVNRMYVVQDPEVKGSLYDAIDCALIAVDEIIKNTTACYEDCFNHDHWEGGYNTKLSQGMVNYWIAVKLEIENI